MARPLRIELADGYYHVMNRDKKRIKAKDARIGYQLRMGLRM
jgi:hypothetical protein